jgi:hypothetical protein
MFSRAMLDTRLPFHLPATFTNLRTALCVISMATMSLRIVCACERSNIAISIAAIIVVYVGTVMLFIMNWFFSQRIVRA